MSAFFYLINYPLINAFRFHQKKDELKLNIRLTVNLL
jgi:hypothetical protein